MIRIKQILLPLTIVAAALFQSCEKDICRDCYIIRSALCTYTDTTLSPYLIPADTVQTYTKCDKEAEFKDDNFKEEKYEYESNSLYFPQYKVHVAVTDIYVCPEKTN